METVGVYLGEPLQKQPLLEDEASDDSYPDDVIDFEETAGHLASIHYRDQFSIHNFNN